METRRREHLSFDFHRYANNHSIFCFNIRRYADNHFIFCFDFHRYANNHLIFTKKKFKQVYVENYHLSPIMDVSLVCKEEMQSDNVRPLVGTWLISRSGVRFWSDWYHPSSGSLPLPHNVLPPLISQLKTTSSLISPQHGSHKNMISQYILLQIIFLSTYM